MRCLTPTVLRMCQYIYCILLCPDVCISIYVCMYVSLRMFLHGLTHAAGSEQIHSIDCLRCILRVFHVQY